MIGVRWGLVLLGLIGLIGLLLPDVAGAAGPCPDRPEVRPTTEGRPDHQWTGNRVVFACVPLRGTVLDADLPAPAVWVVGHPTRPGTRWVVVDEKGGVGELRKGRVTPLGRLAPGTAPLVTRGGRGPLRVRPRSEEAPGVDRLPDGRSVGTGFVSASLAGPTERYAHGALGDLIEASALVIRTDYGTQPRVELPAPAVFEGVAPLAADLGEGSFGFLVTASDPHDGARLQAYDEYGELIAESQPIGEGFRWLHQIGVGPTGPAGEVEVIAVRTPHIGGVVEAYRLDGDRFERVAAIEGYSSHVYGSANVDMALLADTDADDQLEVVVPTQDMTELAILERTSDGFREVARLPLGGQLASNIGAAVDRQGRLSLAAATTDGRLRIFR